MMNNKDSKRENYEIIFDPNDLDILNTALSYNPELCLCAAILKEVKNKKVSFPIQDPNPLIELLPRKTTFVNGHVLNKKTISMYLKEEFLPIKDEKELISKLYLSMMCCKRDMDWVANAPKEPIKVLNEYKNKFK